ncbi:FecR domain-containing protein [uncultured Draconibacterium sp.]|uniref:FecR family protein n=1 Tax=uncultured Draconibacterium sp. TaxID=1573823 RepID=UPI0025D7ED3D|nr:FecR domain-containing protein [uncultured Draconibacterium sp.]
MKTFNKNIYEELIADNRFISWASRRDKSAAMYWEEWRQKHPEYHTEFKEALKTVQLFKFSEPNVTNAEVQFRRQKIQSQLSVSDTSVRVRRLTFWLGRVAAILVLPLIISVLLLYLKNSSVQSAYQQVLEYNNSNPVTVKAPLGGMVNLQLPDGTKVWLNAGSEIKYAASFSAEKREVNLEGEAFFKVEKASVPFVVNNAGPQIKVYGTQFNVNAYNNEKNVIVALEEGRISLNVNNGEQFLEPGEVSVFDKNKRKLTIRKDPIDQYTAWRTGKLIFRDATLAHIARTLERRYNAQIEIADAEIAGYTYNATVRGETFEQILELLRLTAPIKYTYKKPEQNADTTFSKAKVVITRDKNRIIKN